MITANSNRRGSWSLTLKNIQPEGRVRLTRKFAFVGVCVAAIAAGIVALPAGSARAQDQKVLRVAVNADPDMLDMTQSTNPPQALATLSNVYEGLLTYDAEGHIVPDLATSWDIEDGGKVVIFHLRHGVKFQSGDPFTAADVVWSNVRMAKKTWFYELTFARYVKKIEAVDPYTVKFTLSQPDAEFLEVPALIIASKRYYDRVGEKEFTKHPVGTGPYRIVDYKPAQYLDLATWKGYWGKEPQIERARFFFVGDDNTRVTKLQAGEVDMIMATPYSAYAPLKKAGFTEVKLPCHPTQSIQMQFANTHTPWHHLKVREAMAYAIDKKALVDGLLHGVPYYHPRLMPDELGYDPNLNRYSYNPTLAKRLLAEAGYPNGFTMPLYYTTGTYFGTEETAEAVVLYLKQNLNITSKVHGMELVQLLQMMGRIGNSPKGEYVGVAGLPIANLPTPLEGISLAYTGAFALYHNKELDQLFAQADAILDPAKQAPLIRKIMEIENTDLSTITLWQYVDVYAMRKGVTYKPARHGLEVVYLPRVHVAM
jgi:peptide/nickel transport system substrate-binding protein